MLERREERKTAIQTAASIGGKPAELGFSWLNLANGQQIFSQLESIGKELDLGMEFKKLLVQSGSWIINLLDGAIEDMLTKMVEQETALQLRKSFGPIDTAIADLSTPVYLGLAATEVFAREDAKNQAINTSEILDQVKNRLFYVIQLFLVSQIEKVENERKAMLVALESSRQKSEGLGELSETMAQVEVGFDNKLKDLEERKIQLLEKFGEVTEYIKQLFGSSQVIFDASRQSLSPTVIS